MKEIVNELVRMGRKKSSGKPNWDCVDVSRVLRNATYMGCVCHNKSKVNNYLEKKRINNLDETSYEIREGNFPAIISPELWFRCEQIRKSRHAEYKMPDGQARRIGCQEPKNLWAQILRCRCGSSYHRFKWRVLKSGVPVYGYQCRFRTENASKSYIHEHHITSIDHCEAIHICEWKLELMAKRIFEQIWGDQKNAILQACQMLDAYSKATALGSHQAQKNLLRQIEKAEKRLSSYAAMRADGEIDRDQFLSLSTGVKEEIQNLRTQMDTKNAVSNAEPIVDLARVKKVLATMIDVSSPKISDALISEFVEVVTPIEDYCYRWKLNFNPDSPRNVQTDLTHPNTPPVLCFSITFENAKEYRQANQMPTQFRRCAWNDLHVEVYM